MRASGNVVRVLEWALYVALACSLSFLPVAEMEYRMFEPLKRPLSRLILGTGRFHLAVEQDAFDLFDHWLELGGNSLDSAHVYRGGESERVVGKWIVARGCRQQVVLISKGAHPDVDFRPRVTPAAINADLTESLQRLETDYIDIYLLHRDDPSMPVGPLIEALNEHVAAGRIRCFGASNWTLPRLEEAAEYADAKGLNGFACSSPQLSLATQNVAPWTGCVSASDFASLNWYRRTRLVLLAWSSQARGFFGCGVEKNCDDDPEMARIYYNEANWERHRRVSELARQRGCTNTAVALAWVLAQPFPVHALVGSRTLDQLDASAAAFDISLTPDDLAWLAASV